MADLTILIPTRNRPDFLAHALSSVRESFGTRTNVIIGDNGDYKVTKELLYKNDDFGLNIKHIQNPDGSTYVFNLQTLINLVTTDWLSILHDDDFFVGECWRIILPLLKEISIEFIFSDHWVTSHSGELLMEETKQNSINYKRSLLRTGKIDNLSICAIEQRICLDGFFIKTSLAQRVHLGSAATVFSDIRWLIEVCDLANRGFYVAEKLFAYRVNESGLTAAGLDQNEMLSSLIQSWSAIKNNTTKIALKARIISQSKNSFLFSIKRRRLKAAFHALLTNIRFRYSVHIT